MGLTITDELEWVACCSCGVAIGMPASLVKARRADQKPFFCANGHSQSFTESSADRLQRQLTEAERQRDVARGQRDTANARAEHAEKKLKRALRSAGK